MNQIQFLGPKFRSQVQESVLDLGLNAWKWSQNWDLSPRKVPRFRSQVLNQVLQELCPKEHLYLGQMSQIQVLGSRKCPRVMSQITDLAPRSLENFLDLGPISQDYVLGTGEVPRIRVYVLEKLLDLVSMLQKRSQIQVYYSFILSRSQ